MLTFYIDKEITDDLASELQVFIDRLCGDTESEITFYFNSNGGSVQAGMAIYDIISALQNPKKAVILGMCASAATYPALACDTIEMKPNSKFLVHPVSGGLYGTIEELEKDLDYMIDMEGRMIAIYAAKTGLSPEEVRGIVARGEYLSPQQALDLGFVDFCDGLSKTPAEAVETPEEPQETPEKVEEEAPENEKRGFVNRILTLAGVKKRGEIFHRPAEVEEDFRNEIKNLNEALKNKEVEVENLSKSLENKQADFEAYKETQIREIEELKNTISNSISTLEDRVKTEVHNRLAALGYDADNLPAPQEMKNTAAVEITDTERFLYELGLK